MGVVGGADELDVHPYLVLLLLDAPLENGADAELPCDLPYALVRVLEAHRGGAGDDLEVVNLRELRDDVLRHAVAEVLLILRRAVVLEGQHRDRIPPCGSGELRSRRGNRGLFRLARARDDEIGACDDRRDDDERRRQPNPEGAAARRAGGSRAATAPRSPRSADSRATLFRSTMRSSACWYRSEGFLASAFFTIRSSSIGIPERSDVTGSGSSIHDRIERRLIVLAGEGMLPRQHLVEHRAEREDVAPRIDLLAARLLGRHVLRRAERRARLRELRPRRASRDRSRRSSRGRPS